MELVHSCSNGRLTENVFKRFSANSNPNPHPNSKSHPNPYPNSNPNSNLTLNHKSVFGKTK